MNAIPTTEHARPTENVASTMRENALLASSFFPAPKSWPTIALPPAPIMIPSVERITTNGMTMVTDASASLPTIFDTNNPSTALYAELNSIMAIVGNVYFKRERLMKC